MPLKKKSEMARAQAGGSPACARAAAAIRVVAAAKAGDRKPSCAMALLVAGVAMGEIASAGMETRRRLRQGGKGCPQRVAKGAADVAALLDLACVVDAAEKG